jgi:iron complex outermembrane receptor protein
LTLRYDNYYFKAEDNLLTDGNNSGRRSMYNFSPAAGIILLPMPYIKLYANYAESFQTPTTNELSNNPSGGGGFNPTLEPEKIRSYEIGAWGILQSYKLNFEAALFVMKFNNMLISYQSQEIGEEEIFYKNAGRAENIGGELRLDWNPLKEIDLIVSYTKMNFTFKDYNVQFSNDNGDLEYKQLKGKYIPGIPEDYLSAGISYRSPMGLFLKLQTQWSGSYFTNDFNGPAPDFNSAEKNYINNAYLKTDLILGYKLKAAGYMIDFSGEVYNVFSKRYNASIVPNAAGERFFEPSPGRNLYFKIETEF